MTCFFNHIVDSETNMFLCVSTGCACTAVNQHDDSSIHSFVSKMSENSQNIVFLTSFYSLVFSCYVNHIELTQCMKCTI